MRTIIDKELIEQAKIVLKRMGKVGTVAKKLQAVIAAHKHGINKVSEVMNVSKASIYLWAKQVKEEDFDRLINKSKHQDGVKLKKNHKEAIKEWLDKNPSITIKEVKKLLAEHYDIEVSKSTVHRSMKEVGFSYITGRKHHYKQNKEAVENFKK